MYFCCVVILVRLWYAASAAITSSVGTLELSSVRNFRGKDSRPLPGHSLGKDSRALPDVSIAPKAPASFETTSIFKLEDFNHAQAGQVWLELAGRDVDLKFVNLTAEAWGAHVVSKVWSNKPFNRELPHVWQAPASQAKDSNAGSEEERHVAQECIKRSAEWQVHHALEYDLNAVMEDSAFAQVSVMALQSVFATFEGLVFNSTHYSVGIAAAPPNVASSDLADLSVDVALYQAPFETLKNMGMDPHFGQPWNIKLHLCNLFFREQLRTQLLENNFGWYDEMFSFLSDQQSGEDPSLMRCEKGRVHVFSKAGTTLGLYAGNFFHWLAGSLPRAVALQAALGHEALSLPTLTYGHQFAQQGLELLGFKPAVLSADSVAFVHELYVVEGLSQDWMESSQTVQALRNTVLSRTLGTGSGKAVVDGEEASQVLLISRADHGRKNVSSRVMDASGTSKLNTLRLRFAKQRELLNEAAVLDAMVEALPSGNVSQVRMAEHSFTEQVRLFHGAAVVVGVDGAGLANLVFAKPGAVIIDLLPTQKRFGLLPNECGTTYFWHLAEALRPGGVALQFWSLKLPNANWNSAIQVPINSLVALLQHAVPNLAHPKRSSAAKIPFL